MYFPVIYLLFPETKGRTLEEVGCLFGDENVASRWYDLDALDRAQITAQAVDFTAELGNYKVQNRSQAAVERA